MTDSEKDAVIAKLQREIQRLRELVIDLGGRP
jgi:hypothetical protein